MVRLKEVRSVSYGMYVTVVWYGCDSCVVCM
jgi:hypothetical protein